MSPTHIHTASSVELHLLLHNLPVPALMMKNEVVELSVYVTSEFCPGVSLSTAVTYELDQ